MPQTITLRYARSRSDLYSMSNEEGGLVETTPMNAKRIVLNLLVSLEALLRDANVSHAAARLNSSQPALSAQLRKLRDMFDDPLLVPADSGRGMVPTAGAIELAAPLHDALHTLRSLGES